MKSESEIEIVVDHVRKALLQYIDTPVQELKKSLEYLENLVIDGSYGGYRKKLEIIRNESIVLLKNNILAREKYDAEQAELERKFISGENGLLNESMQSMIDLGFDEDTSKKALIAIHNGKIKHVFIDY